MRALVTGGSGFVGRHLLAALRDRGDEAISAAPSLGDDEHLPLDLRDVDNVRAVVEIAQADVVFHLAAQAFVPASLASPLTTYETNVMGTAHVVEALREAQSAGAKTRLVFISSAEIYGRRAPHEMPLGEGLPPQPANPYAASKAAGEAIVVASHRAFGLDALVARTFNHIGPGQDQQFAVPAFAARLARIAAGAPPLLPVGNLEAERDFLDVRDVVRAYLALAERGVSGETYNVCSGEGVAIREVLRRLVMIAGVAVEIREDPALMRPSDTPRFVGDGEKLRTHTGWQPEISLGVSLAGVYSDAVAREAAVARSGEDAV